MNKIAATINLGPSGGEGFRGFGALGLEGKSNLDAPGIFGNVISTTVGVITVVGIIWFVVQLLTAAISIIGSGGDKNKIEQARAKMSSAVIGLVVVVAGVFIVDLVGAILGFNILNISALIFGLGGQ